MVDGDQQGPQHIREALALPRGGLGPERRVRQEFDRDRWWHEGLPGCLGQPGSVLNKSPFEKGSARQATMVPGAAAVTAASTWVSNFSKFFRNMPTSFAAWAS